MKTLHITGQATFLTLLTVQFKHMTLGLQGSVAEESSPLDCFAMTTLLDTGKCNTILQNV
jgi:hypothetical protein